MSSTQQKPTRGANPRGKLKGAEPNTCEAKQPTHKGQLGNKMLKNKGNNTCKCEDMGVIN